MDHVRDDSPTANTTQKTASNIMVAVRLRPLSKSEVESNDVSIVRILDEKLVILRDPLDFEDD